MMEIKKNLQKMLSPIRLGWSGLLVMGTGVSLSYSCIDSLPDTINGFILGASLGIGLNIYFTSLYSFMRTSHNIKKKGDLDRRMVENQLYHYCNRQGARTAAANFGYTEKFDNIMADYEGRMLLTKIPLI
jgi:hypothetical protein